MFERKYKFEIYDQLVSNSAETGWVASLEIDEHRTHTLTKYATKTRAKTMTESDHNTLIMRININWNTNLNENHERSEIYNFRNEDNFKLFKEATENNYELLHCFDDSNEDIKVSTNRWLSTINLLIKKSFNPIRINYRKSANITLDDLLEKKNKFNETTC